MTPDPRPKAELRRAALARRAALPASARALFSERLTRLGAELALRHAPRIVIAPGDRPKPPSTGS